MRLGQAIQMRLDLNQIRLGRLTQIRIRLELDQLDRQIRLDQIKQIRLD